MAIAHKILVISYHVLKTRLPYHDLGVDFLEKRKSFSKEQLMIRRLEKLGYTVIAKQNTAATH